LVSFGKKLLAKELKEPSFPNQPNSDSFQVEKIQVNGTKIIEKEGKEREILGRGIIVRVEENEGGFK
jgi:hypothetical protein